MILNQRHTGLVVRDIERSIRFYGALGLKVWRRETETGPFIDAVVGIPGVQSYKFTMLATGKMIRQIGLVT